MISYACLSPHPPLIIPAIGGDNLKEVTSTVNGMRNMARDLVDTSPDMVIFLTPHGNVFADCISYLSEPDLAGDFSNFGHQSIGARRHNDLLLAKEITKQASEQGIDFVGINQDIAHRHHLNAGIDHGILVPLYYLEEAGLKDIPIVAISIGYLSVPELYNFGRILASAAAGQGRKIALVASGDMSHRLKDDGPYTFHTDGPRYDESIKIMLADKNIEGILELPHALLENAGECGYRSLVITLGALDEIDFKVNIFSYEGPFGVGYLVAGLKPQGKVPSLFAGIEEKHKKIIHDRRSQESPPVKLARMTLESYVINGQIPDFPEEFAYLQEQHAASFVSLKKNGQLRGCIGTILPYHENLAQEIINNAVSAGSRDPRFSPVTKRELNQLVYSVDILGQPEPCNRKDLDPKKYGVIVSRGHKRGVLLPDLEGVDTVEEQLEIALQKADIPRGQKYQMERFEVKRFT